MTTVSTPVSTPVWTPWTTYYDPAGQAPVMAAELAADGLSVTYQLNNFTLSLQGSNDDSLAGAVALSGVLSVDLPAQFNLAGCLLVINGTVWKTARSEAVVTGSIGSGPQYLQLPSSSPTLTDQSRRPADPNPDGSADRGTGAVTESDFSLDCFTGASNPSATGPAPQPPLAPLPVTVSMQARRATADETILVTISDFSVVMLLSS
jgi:hypothetical protein